MGKNKGKIEDAFLLPFKEKGASEHIIFEIFSK